MGLLRKTDLYVIPINWFLLQTTLISTKCEATGHAMDHDEKDEERQPLK